MIIWKPLVGEYLQCVKEPTNKMGKNVATNPACKKDVVAYV